MDIPPLVPFYLYYTFLDKAIQPPRIYASSLVLRQDYLYSLA